MSNSPIAPVTGTPVPVATAPAPVAPAPKLNAIQLIEQEIGNFIKQREQAIANVHAVEGAIQAAQFLLGKLKAEAAKAEGEVKTLVTDAKAEVSKVATFVETEAKKL